MAAKRRRRKFRVNDYVVYPAHGVGRITGVEKSEISGAELELFVISVDSDNLVLRVPTAKVDEIGVRVLSTSEEVGKALTVLKGKARVKRTMWSRRAQEYEQKINSGRIIEIAEVLRDLHRKDEQKEQSYSERQLYETALNRMSREVSVVEGMKQAAAQEKITGLLAARTT